VRLCYKTPMVLFWLLCICGMSVSYADTLCSDTLSNAESGVLTDSGTSIANYGHNQTCTFVIRPASGGPVVFSLLSFATEFFFDRLQIYDGTTTSGRLLATLSGNRSPQHYRANSGTITVRFSSDASVSRPGFVASWSSVNTQHGLLGSYYHQQGIPRQYFTGSPVVRIDPRVDFDWGSGAPIAGVGRDDFSARWVGEVEIPVSGNYTFSTRSDDGVRLWINGQLVVDNWSDHGETTDSGLVAGLLAGQRYSVVMEFYERGGRAVARLLWRGPGVSQDIIPEHHLFRETTPPRLTRALRSCIANQVQLSFSEPITRDSAENLTNYSVNNGAVVTTASLDESARNVTLQLADTSEQTLSITARDIVDLSGNIMGAPETLTTTLGVNGLLGTYFNQNGSSTAYFSGASVSRIDATVDFNWASNAPIAGVGTDFFSVRWVGEIEAPRSGRYQFSTRSDDGVRLWIDNQLVIDNWTLHAARRDTSAPIELVAGRRYDIRMEFFEYAGHAVAQLEWQGPGIARQIIPAGQLFLACPNTPTLDHFSINHDGSGIHCLTEPVVVAAMSSSGIYHGYNASVTLDTQTGDGVWSLLSGNGRLVNNGSSGVASYDYDPTDRGVATFGLFYPEGHARFDIDAYAGTVRDDDTEGVITFSASGFSVTASALANPPPTVISDPVGTQVAGREFTLNIAAYGTLPGDDQCGIIETYQGEHRIVLASEHINPDSGTVIATGPETVSFIRGQATLPVNYEDVGRIRLSATDRDNALAGATNTFVVQPADFSVVATNNPSTTSTGSGFVAAGEPFTVVVEALTETGAVAANYGRESPPESVTLGIAELVFPVGGNSGKLESANRFSGLGAGRFRNIAVSWSEVGSVSLYAQVADADYLNTGNITGRNSAPVGRFYPDHFTLLRGQATHQCGSFAYLSQPGLTVDYQLQAQARDNNPVANYDSALSYPVAGIRYHAEHNNNGIDLGGRAEIASSIWRAGDYSVLDNRAAFMRTTIIEAPLSSLQLGISINDVLDNRALHGLSMNPSTASDCLSMADCQAVRLGGELNVLFGRLSLPDAYGPETAQLGVQLYSEYWNGAQFVRNQADSCTRIARTDIRYNTRTIASTLSVDLGGGTTVSRYGELTPSDIGLNNGDGQLSFSAPGLDITRNRINVDINLSASPWLRFDWNQDGRFDDNTLPTATMRFQSYRGHDRILYWQERFD